jgi:hypothetical protein
VRQVAVPDVAGLAEQDALSLLDEAGLEGVVDERASSEEVAAGLVLAQDPEAGTEVDEGSDVSLTVSTGPLPDLAIRIDEVTDDCTGGSCTTRVSFTVSNLSEGLVAGPFEITVDAEGSDAVTVELDGLGPREIRKLVAESSGSCFDPDCFATAEVDSGGDVEETNEENNAAEFSVIG